MQELPKKSNCSIISSFGSMSRTSKGGIKSHLVNLDDYQIIQEISPGIGNSTIFLIEHKHDGHRLVAKVIPNAKLTEEQSKLVSREISILLRVQSPTIIRFYGFSLQDFNGKQNPTLLMEYKENGSLQQLIEKEQKGLSSHNYDNTAKQIILCGIAHGMMQLHLQRVIHRDLKPDNVLLDEHLYPCVTDFGLSKFLDSTTSRSQSMMCCGTVPYMAPEVISDTHYSTKSDVYSFGILMYELLTGEIAFSELYNKRSFNPFQITTKVMNGERPTFKVPIQSSLKKLIEQCWDQDPRKRPTFQEIFHKLSLSLEDDEETIESTLHDIISNPNDSNGEFDHFRYCLENVDVDLLFNYIDEITNKPISNEENVQNIFEEQNKRIAALEKKHHEEISIFEQLKSEYGMLLTKNQQEIEALKLQNQRNEEEIKLLKSKLNESSNQNEEQPEISESQSSVSIPETTTTSLLEQVPAEPKKDSDPNDNPMEISSTLSTANSISETAIPSPVISTEKEYSSTTNHTTETTIPSSIISIGKGDLSNSLTEITIPSSVILLREYAFSGFSLLQKITIPSSVKLIGNYAFEKCSSLIEIPIPSSVKTIGHYAFSDCSSLTQITIPLSVKTIGNYVFNNCKSLAQITIPTSVTSIGNYIFNNCISLTQITIPSSVASIGSSAFSNCSSLTQITIPSLVTSIESSAFSNCSSLAQITIPSSVTSIENRTFSNCSSLTEITIPTSVKTIGNYAFSNCSSLTQITIPSSVTSIGYCTFENCSSLTQITIPSSVTSIGSSAFSNCSSLTQITIPSSVTTIGQCAFYKCSSLFEIKIPSSVTSIESYAFSDCNSLFEITIPSSVESIGNHAFRNCLLEFEFKQQLQNKYRTEIF